MKVDKSLFRGLFDWSDGEDLQLLLLQQLTETTISLTVKL